MKSLVAPSRMSVSENTCLIGSVELVARQGESGQDRQVRGARVGYVRVSTVLQTLEQQEAALNAAGVVKMFSDTMSGARDDRPGLAALMEYVRAGDTVVVWKLDRLGRNLQHILETVKTLTERGVTLVSVTDGIDSSTAAGRMKIGVLRVPGRIRARADQGTNRPEARSVSSQRHQVRPAQAC